MGWRWEATIRLVPRSNPAAQRKIKPSPVQCGRAPMIPRLDILPASQRALWPDLSEIPTDFVLYGGTALALRLGHRTSEDFDFFSNQSFQPDELERRIPFLAGSTRLQSSPNTLVSRVDRDGPVKVSFFGGLTLRRVQDPERVKDPGLAIASLLDL